MKKVNPDFPILVRECSGIQPRVYARFGKYPFVAASHDRFKHGVSVGLVWESY